MAKLLQVCPHSGLGIVNGKDRHHVEIHEQLDCPCEVVALTNGTSGMLKTFLALFDPKAFF